MIEQETVIDSKRTDFLSPFRFDAPDGLCFAPGPFLANFYQRARTRKTGCPKCGEKSVVGARGFSEVRRDEYIHAGGKFGGGCR